MLVRVPWLSSFVPFVFSSSTERMDFFERVQNFLLTVIFSSINMLPQPEASVMTKYQEYGEFGSLNDIVASSVLWITTRDVVLDYSKPVMPNMIDAGGLTVKPATGQLPAEIAQFADGAEKGLIIFSFESASNRFPSLITKKFLSTFERLPGYRIIWIFGSDKETVLPDNVMALEWLPQNELLAHPKTKLFITHCGNNGQFEALYHAVPMIGFPLDGDQPYNARRMEYRGYGIAMYIHEFTSDELLNNVHRVLSNLSYSENIGLASSIWRSSLQRLAEKAVWWIEHVTKFGSKHLNSFGHQLQPSPVLLIRRDGVSFNRGRTGVGVSLENDQISGEDDPEPRKRQIKTKNSINRILDKTKFKEKCNLILACKAKGVRRRPPKSIFNKHFV